MPDVLHGVALVDVGVTWRETHADEDHPFRLRQAADQTTAESITHCSDLLDDFLRTISRMENEYLRAAMEGERF
ncbi:hypothetical protein [Streptomyces regalis]|uniref:Uncharacterized protein n=1 Tax=Streptomyces regalis TaxID=68262 RepID=A0A101J5R8_9ACTN|nr:hypothetical protein [Streptomyces regalis]KUL20616.1 hypothetical protein ADL12_48465 [Streptomyces regalis]